MSKEPLIQVGVLLTRQQHASLKQLSSLTHVPITAIVRQAVDDLLTRHPVSPNVALGLNAQRRPMKKGAKS
jgi:hypothetical protein